MSKKSYRKPYYAGKFIQTFRRGNLAISAAIDDLPIYSLEHEKGYDPSNRCSMFLTVSGLIAAQLASSLRVQSTRPRAARSCAGLSDMGDQPGAKGNRGVEPFGRPGAVKPDMRPVFAHAVRARAAAEKISGVIGRPRRYRPPANWSARNRRESAQCRRIPNP